MQAEGAQWAFSHRLWGTFIQTNNDLNACKFSNISLFIVILRDVINIHRHGGDDVADSVKQLTIAVQQVIHYSTPNLHRE
jgi:hypothetical protein